MTEKKKTRAKPRGPNGDGKGWMLAIRLKRDENAKLNGLCKASGLSRPKLVTHLIMIAKMGAAEKPKKATKAHAKATENKTEAAQPTATA